MFYNKALKFCSIMNLNTLFLVFVTVTLTTASIPSNIKKCNRKDPDFEKCIPQAIEDLVKKASSPIKEMHLVPLEPLYIPVMSIEVGTSAVNVKQVYKNLNISGFSKAKCFHANMDFDAPAFTLDCTAPVARLDFTHEVSGKVLMLPVYGTGLGWVELVEVNMKSTFNFEKINKNGKEHYKITTTKITLTPQLLRVNMENLFNGDKVMTDNLNKLINENWKQIFDEIKSTYEDMFQRIFGAIFDQVLAKVSIAEMFGEA